MNDAPGPRNSDSAADNDLPLVEDAAEFNPPAEEAIIEDPVEEARLDAGARSLDDLGVETDPVVPKSVSSDARTQLASGLDDDTSDMGRISDAGEVPSGPSTPGRFRKGDWESSLSAHHVGVELKRIETEVRAILEDRDPKRKRKLNGTHRWHELEDDLLSLRFTGRIDEDSIRRLLDLIYQRHHLFRHLRFLASTRPTWNT